MHEHSEKLPICNYKFRFYIGCGLVRSNSKRNNRILKNQNTKFLPEYETTTDTIKTCYSIYPIHLVQQTPNKNSWRQTTFKPSLLCQCMPYMQILQKTILIIPPPPQYFARLTYKKSGVKNTRSRRFLGNRLIQQESVQKRLKLSANRSNPYIYRY